MNKKSVLGFGAAAALLVIAILTVLSLTSRTQPAALETPQPAAAGAAQTAAAGGAKSAAGAAGKTVAAKAARPAKGAAATSSRNAASTPGAAVPAEPPSEVRVQAVKVWEAFIDEVAERTAKPTAEQALEFKESFHKLDPADQMEGLQTALNLLPDEQFPLLYPILFDKKENRDVLDDIFSDALNRDEDLKVPIMKEIYKDREHPLFAEASRILDVTGELDEMNTTDKPQAVDGNIP
jgi:hypothetical protein